MHPKMSNLQWFEHIKTYGSKPGLQTIRELLTLLGDPQGHFASIHITGTNGKGSTTAITASTLESAGYKVGAFTSPHLSKINESIKINEIEIPTHIMDHILGDIRDKTEELVGKGNRHPTYFEVLVALAFVYFQNEDVDIAVVEVGMGGRDDATNVIQSMASIVTNISLEHTQWLGETEVKIAEIKAGILREGTELITAVTQLEVLTRLREIATQRKSIFTVIGDDINITPESSSLQGQQFTIKTPSQTLGHLTTSLLGDHQLRNAACAIAAIEAARRNGFKISVEAIKSGLISVKWPGRFEVIQEKPLIILDGAKDAKAIQSLVEAIKKYLPERSITTIVGISSDKNHQAMIECLAEITEHFILTEHRVRNRTATAEALQKIAETTGKTTQIITPLSEAIRYAKENVNPESVILITGSVFLIGEARESWYPI